MKNIKTFASTFAAGAAIAAASLLTVAPASAATQPTVQHGRTLQAAPQRQAERPASPTEQRTQQEERQRAEKEAQMQRAEQRQQQVVGADGIEPPTAGV
jgi:hypothetical protein